MAISKTTELRKRIVATKEHIAKLFVDQCQNGVQTKCLESYEAAACGQFIGGNAKNSKQRGLHGTAAALLVLAEANSEDSRALIPKIITYLEKRENIEVALQKDEQKARQKCDLDAKNTIKISEILYALSLIGPGVQSTESLVRKLAEQLVGSIREGKGWSYFIDDDNGPELLPTAYAILGLSANGYSEAENALKYLVEVLEKRYVKNKTEQIKIDADIIVDVVCLYAVTFAKAQKRNDIFKTVFKIIWQKLKPLLSEPLEQNIEYSYKRQKNCYVRIPWQLYLVALSAHYDFNWAFSGSAVQKKLYNILDMLRTEDALIYPHSGRMVSSRTNSILFEVLSILEGKLVHKNIFWLGGVKDTTAGFIQHRCIRLPAGIILALVTIFFIYKWWREGTIADLGANLLAAVWGSLLVIAFKK